MKEKLQDRKYYIIKTDHDMLEIAFWNDEDKRFEANTSRGPNYCYTNHVVGVMSVEDLEFKEIEY